jgi:sodium-independent sulfate anion transporter 11
MGLTALAMLYLIRAACKYAAKRYPQKQKLFFFLSTLRTVFVILLYTMISWLVNRKMKKGKAKFKILFNVPRGASKQYFVSTSRPPGLTSCRLPECRRA